MKTSAVAPGRDGNLLADAVRRQLDRVLASKFFRSSPRQQLLLRTIVTESLAGRGEMLKEIVLARDVFGRDDYDPRRHTLVRVEINGVRRKLTEYYAQGGREDCIHIDIPRGHYLATFSSLPAKRPARRWRKGWYGVAASSIIVLSAVVVLLVTRRPPPTPTGVPVQITFDTGWTAQPAVSRDGSLLVYASDRGPRGNTDIWIQQAGKPPRQLTNDPAHAITPDISPDGKHVVFRSWRKPEGVWSISADGQNLKLLARGGYNPRFSPDGKWITFSGMATDSAGHLYIIPAEGGVPEQMDYGTTETEWPVWSPDGSELVFAAKNAKGANYDLWTAKVGRRRKELAQPLGIHAQLRAHDLPTASYWPQEWIAHRLFFVAHERDTGFLFQVSLESSGAIGQIRPVPSAIGATAAKIIRGRNGALSLLFSTERRETNIWESNLNGSVPLEQVTHDSSLWPGWNGTWPALSGDGSVLGFITYRTGSPDICLKDLRTGTQQLLAASPFSESPLFLDRSGRKVVFVRKQGSTVSVILRNVAEKTDRLVTTECPVLQDWSSDGELLLCADGSDLFQLRIGQPGKTPLLHLTREPERARFSPDARWLSFVSTTGQGESIAGYLAPLDGSNRTIQIDQEVYTLSLDWAPDGNAIYFWSLRDGFRCLYMQRLHPKTKIPQGAPVAILHRHGSQHYPWSGGTLAVGSGRMAMTLSDELANIWKTGLAR